MPAPVPLEELLRAAIDTRKATLGLPASKNPADHRFPLTPEGAGLLVERGFRVLMERGAAKCIHYTDEAYVARGVELCDRRSALSCDIVVYLQAFDVSDAREVKRGALLLTFMHTTPDDAIPLGILLQRHVIALALDRITDEHGNLPFADILHEIDGRAAIAVASSLLADAIHGKGILLGGVAGVVPCEVMIIGSDIAACAAAQSAIGLGAMVRMFDNDVYRLREAMHRFGSSVICSAMHPKVFESALRSADIIIATDTNTRRATIDSDLVSLMKRGVICFDLTANPGKAFPSMQVIDLDLASPEDNDISTPARLCYINAGNAVPRTVAMALSNTFVTMLDDILVCDGVANALKLNDGLRRAAFLFLSKCVNPTIARLLGVRSVDINLFLQFS